MHKQHKQNGSEVKHESAEKSSPPIGFDPARKRNWRGQFIKRLRMTPDGSREWLIWSRYHNAWHRRCRDTGGACGYTGDIAQAGLFPRDKASSYNDGDRNEAFHVHEKIDLIRAEIARHNEAIHILAITTEAQRAETVEQGSVHDGAGPKDIANTSSATNPVEKDEI